MSSIDTVQFNDILIKIVKKITLSQEINHIPVQRGLQHRRGHVVIALRCLPNHGDGGDVARYGVRYDVRRILFSGPGSRILV
jgi:hypothetical protein